jgi:lipoprotein-anchoring transpeptidase ErfK/SrfK
VPAFRRPRIALATILALVPLVPILVAIVVTSGHAGRAAGTIATFTPVTTGAFATPAPAPAPPNPAPGEPGSAALIAHVTRTTALRAAPGGPVIKPLKTRTEFGSPEFLWVARTAPGWLGVITPLAGNGKLGWIPASAATLSRSPWELRVSLATHTLSVIRSGRTLARYPVAIGRPSAPTPTGTFAVTDRLSTGSPAGSYGCCILALSAVSPHPIEGWTGGNRVAIHSTPDASSIGKSVSHGCVRVAPGDGRWLLEHVPLGTPTVIRS